MPSIPLHSGHRSRSKGHDELTADDYVRMLQALVSRQLEAVLPCYQCLLAYPRLFPLIFDVLNIPEHSASSLCAHLTLAKRVANFSGYSERFSW